MIIPGISSALAAPLLAGIPVTQRGVADTLVVCTAVGKGGKGGVLVGYERGRSVAILMGVARLGEVVRALVSGSSVDVKKDGGKAGLGQDTTPTPSRPTTAATAGSLLTPTTPSIPTTSASTLSTTKPPTLATSALSTTSASVPTPTTASASLPPTPISTPLTLSGPTYPPYTPIAIIERGSSPDQRLVASTLNTIESALDRSGGQRPPGMILVGWAVLALSGDGELDVLDDAEGKLEDVEKRDRARVGRWLGGKEFVVREGLGDGWEAFEGLGATASIC